MLQLIDPKYLFALQMMMMTMILLEILIPFIKLKALKLLFIPMNCLLISGDSIFPWNYMIIIL